jgi:hypothetical protein
LITGRRIAAYGYISAALSSFGVAYYAAKKTVPFGMRVLAKETFNCLEEREGIKGTLCTSLMTNEGLVCKYCFRPNSPFTSVVNM